MELQDLANIGEFVSGVVVVITLAYLALQIRQNTKSLRMENYARALDRLATMQASLARDGDMAVLISRGAEDGSSLSPRERLQFNWFFTEFFGALEFMFHAAEDRALPDAVWGRWAYAAAFWLSLPGVRSWWHNVPIRFTPGFTAFIETVLTDDSYDPALIRRFGDYIADQRPASDSTPAAL